MKRTVVFLLALILPACSTTQVKVRPTSLAPTSVQATASWEDINKAFARTLNGCSRVLTGFEREAMEAKQVGKWVRIVGLMLGSVVLPGMVVAHAAGSSIAVVGGAAGAANAIPDVLAQSDLAPADFLLAREGVRREMRLVLPKYYESVEKNDKRQAISAINQLHATCVTYALEAPGVEVGE